MPRMHAGNSAAPLPKPAAHAIKSLSSRMILPWDLIDLTQSPVVAGPRQRSKITLDGASLLCCRSVPARGTAPPRDWIAERVYMETKFLFEPLDDKAVATSGLWIPTYRAWWKGKIVSEIGAEG